MKTLNAKIGNKQEQERKTMGLAVQTTKLGPRSDGTLPAQQPNDRFLEEIGRGQTQAKGGGQSWDICKTQSKGRQRDVAEPMKSLGGS